MKCAKGHLETQPNTGEEWGCARETSREHRPRGGARRTDPAGAGRLRGQAGVSRDGTVPENASCAVHAKPRPPFPHVPSNSPRRQPAGLWGPAPGPGWWPRGGPPACGWRGSCPVLCPLAAQGLCPSGAFLPVPRRILAPSTCLSPWPAVHPCADVFPRTGLCPSPRPPWELPSRPATASLSHRII